MSEIERILETCLLLAPHRRRLVLEAAVALLEMQFEVDTGRDAE